MGVHAVPWEERVMREANTFWFYALSLSLLGSLYGIMFPAPVELEKKTKSSKKKNSEKSEKSEKPAPKADTSALWKQVVVDSCDLLIPAELLNWMPTGDLVLGVTMVISTLLTGSSIWARV